MELQVAGKNLRTSDEWSVMMDMSAILFVPRLRCVEITPKAHKLSNDLNLNSAGYIKLPVEAKPYLSLQKMVVAADIIYERNETSYKLLFPG